MHYIQIYVLFLHIVIEFVYSYIHFISNHLRLMLRHLIIYFTVHIRASSSTKVFQHEQALEVGNMKPSIDLA